MEAEDAETHGDYSLPATTRRACDQCRLRKIRCDKESPCSNCRSAKRSCCSTGAGQKPKEQRQRVLISSQYERKIDQIEDRLASIETLLRNLSLLSGPPQRQPAPSFSEPSTSARTSTELQTPSSRDDTSSTIFDPDDPADNFEGNSSLAAHTAFASEFLAHAVQRTSLEGGGIGTNPRFDAALSSLRQIVDLQNRQSVSSRGAGQKSVPKTNLRDLPLPPMGLVVEKLRALRHGPVPVMLAVIYCFEDIDHFTDQCRRLYFNTDDPPETTFILVNAGLVYVFFEAVLAAKDANEKAQYETCRSMCQTNLETALAQLNLMMPATSENIEALLMSASFCIDVSRPSLAWLLVSQAAHMCRTLGWHQASTMRDDSPKVKADKSLLFWCTYMLDKALSLRLGRAAILQDYDISLPHIAPEARASYPGKEVMTLWIKQARVQGRVYERLYSPGALRQPDGVRLEQARLLAAEQKHLLGQTMALYREFESAPSAEGRMFALILKSDEVSYLSVLALTYRAIPPAPGSRSRTFSDECVDVARASMRCHNDTMEMMDDQSLKIVYIHWTILYAPFIPFIVIFCLVIETSSPEDLQLLADFVQSLWTTYSISESVNKLYQLCQVLYNVAVLYVEAKAQEPVDQDMIPVGNEFDMYLSQLGFMPMDESMAGNGGGGGSGDGNVDDLGVDGQTRSMAQTAQLGDWFSGNNYMLGLLEEDLSDLSVINPTGWPA